MTKLNENEPKSKGINIEGAIITPEIITAITQLQDENNSLLGYYSLNLADIICFLLECEAPLNKESKKTECMMQLNNIREVITSLKKP